jgi:hypothetical protein
MCNELNCEHCGNECEETITVENTECCQGCVDSFTICHDCNEPTLESTTVENNEYCQSCFESLPYCVHCEETVLEVDEHNHCPDCEDNYCNCIRCNDRVLTDNCVDDSDDEPVCESCQENGCIPVDSDYWYHYDDLHYSERTGEYYAYHSSSINDYHGSEKTKISGSISGKYIGFELEVVPLKDRYEVAKYLLESVDDIHCENDGSINCDNHSFDEDGFEVISNYGELSMVLEIAEKVADNLQGRAVSFEANCCGLHVHLSRQNSVFDNAKFVVFWNDPENWQFLKQFTHRDSESWAERFPDKNKKNLNSTIEKVKNGTSTYAMFTCNSSKYELIKFSNHTIEIRGFKGTLHKPRLLACIELAYYSYEYCKLDICVDKLVWQDFMEWLPEESKYIRPYFETRKDKIKEVEQIVEDIVEPIPQPIAQEIRFDNSNWSSYTIPFNSTFDQLFREYIGRMSRESVQQAINSNPF